VIVKNRRYRDSRTGHVVLLVARHVHYERGVRVWLGRDEEGCYGNYPVEFLEELEVSSYEAEYSNAGART